MQPGAWEADSQINDNQKVGMNRGSRKRATTSSKFIIIQKRGKKKKEGAKR